MQFGSKYTYMYKCVCKYKEIKNVLSHGLDSSFDIFISTDEDIDRNIWDIRKYVF